jgi:hypothetical protein
MTLQEQDMCWFGLIMVVDMALELSLPKNPRFNPYLLSLGVMNYSIAPSEMQRVIQL